jgi:hypothetical protein
MSNTVYIDVNTKNSVNVNSTNNRFEYRLPNVMNLPTGTEIGLQSSIVNLKGINGASVEINEDIEETIIYQYYAVDTTYDSPVEKPLENDVANLIDYKLITDLSVKFNLTKEFPIATGVLTQDEQDNLSFAGYTEEIMPLLTQVTSPDGTNIAVPLTGKSRIFIKKGIYSIEKLATKITEQINRTRLINEDNDDVANNNFYKDQKLAQQWNGFFVNNSTCRNFRIQTVGKWGEVNAGTLSPDDASLKYLPFDRVGALDPEMVSTETAFVDQIKGLCDIIAVTPETNRQVRNNARQGGFSAAQAAADAPHTFAKICPAASTQGKYWAGFEASNGYTNPFSRRVFSPTSYNPFYNGFAFGTTGFEIKYDTNNSGYSLSRLHQSRKIPSIDRFGTTLQSAGQECIFNKNPTTAFVGTSNETVIRALTAIMSRTSGILVTNWAFDTARAMTDVEPNYLIPLTPDQKKKCDEYKLFSDFFSSETKAKEAFETTIWSRLGFGYDDIQNDLKDGAGATFAPWYGTDQVVQGFTTDMQHDQTILPQISTIYNPLTEGKVDARIHGQNDASGNVINTPPYRGALPAVSNVQFFNMSGNNVPASDYNNNLAAAAINTAPFQGSVYKKAVMIPVVTTSKDFTAKKLPTLSKNGYMVITSDLVEPVDILKNQQNSGVLDIIPKSNLSNQDYVADRNILTHTLSNPKQVNTISMAILNPDLTDIDLEPDSSFLFRISIPIPKPTNFLATSAQAAKSQQVAGALSAIIQKSTDQGKQGTNLRMDISNIIGDGGGGAGVPDEDLNDIEAVLDAQAGLGAPALEPEPFERDPNYRLPSFQPRLPPIEEALIEPVEGASGRVGIPQAARDREAARVAARQAERFSQYGGSLTEPFGEQRRAEREAAIRRRQIADPRNPGNLLARLQQQLIQLEDFMRNPQLSSAVYEATLNTRNQVERALQQLTAEGVEARPDPRQVRQATETPTQPPTQPPQPPQPPE